MANTEPSEMSVMMASTVPRHEPIQRANGRLAVSRLEGGQNRGAVYVQREDAPAVGDLPPERRDVDAVPVLQQPGRPHGDRRGVRPRTDALALKVLRRLDSGVGAAVDEGVDRLALDHDGQADDLPSGLDGGQHVAEVQVPQAEVAGLQGGHFVEDHGSRRAGRKLHAGNLDTAVEQGHGDVVAHGGNR